MSVPRAGINSFHDKQPFSILAWSKSSQKWFVSNAMASSCTTPKLLSGWLLLAFWTLGGDRAWVTAWWELRWCTCHHPGALPRADSTHLLHKLFGPSPAILLTYFSPALLYPAPRDFGDLVQKCPLYCFKNLEDPVPYHKVRQNEISTLVGFLAMVILSLTDASPSSRPVEGRTPVTSTTCPALLPAACSVIFQWVLFCLWLFPSLVCFCCFCPLCKNWQSCLADSCLLFTLVLWLLRHLFRTFKTLIYFFPFEMPV